MSYIYMPDRKMCIAPSHVFAHWHIFSSIALCHSVEFQMHLSICVPSRARAEKRSSNTHPHNTVLESGSRCSPICAFLSLLSSVLSFSSISHSYFSLPSRLFCVSVSAFLVFARRRKILRKRNGERKKESAESDFKLRVVGI